MGIRLKWMGMKVEAELKQGVRKRLMFIGEHLKKTMMINLSTPVTKVRKSRRRTTSRGKAGSSYTWVQPESRSKPGQFPRAETGLLRDSIIKGFVSPQTMMVGTSKKYGALLETKLDRSFIRRTLNEQMGVVGAIFRKKQPGDGSLFITTS